VKLWYIITTGFYSFLPNLTTCSRIIINIIPQTNFDVQLSLIINCEICCLNVKMIFGNEALPGITICIYYVGLLYYYYFFARLASNSICCTKSWSIFIRDAKLGMVALIRELLALLLLSSNSLYQLAFCKLIVAKNPSSEVYNRSFTPSSLVHPTGRRYVWYAKSTQLAPMAKQ